MKKTLLPLGAPHRCATLPPHPRHSSAPLPLPRPGSLLPARESGRPAGLPPATGPAGGGARRHGDQQEQAGPAGTVARPRLRPLGAEAAASLAAGGQDPASEPTTLLPEGSRLRAPPSASSHHPDEYRAPPQLRAALPLLRAARDLLWRRRASDPTGGGLPPTSLSITRPLPPSARHGAESGPELLEHARVRVEAEARRARGVGMVHERQATGADRAAGVLPRGGRRDPR